MWRFFLANSSDLSVISEITYEAQEKALSLQLNRPGSFSCRINIKSEFIQGIEPLRHCVIAYKDGKAVWSGPIFVIQESMPGNAVSITANGWFELLNRRLLKTQVSGSYPTTTARSHSYSAVDAGEIAWNLIERTNAESNTGIIRGVIQPSQFRTRTYYTYSVIGQEISTLSSIESGFDMWIDPLTREFDVYGSTITGTIKGKGSVKNDALFSYNIGPNNISSISRMIDGARVANQSIAVGRYSTAISNDNDSISKYGLFSELQQLNDVSNADVLKAYATVETTFRARPVEIITFSPLSGEDVPSIFFDYDIGDIVYVAVNYGRMKIPSSGSDRQAVRIFAANISIDSNGIERVSDIQTNAAGS